MARRIKAAYKVSPPVKLEVSYRKYHVDKKTRALEYEEVKEKLDCYMVQFPQGHSIRCTSHAKLKELKLHLKPRMVDLDTGDVVDSGGDPYDFGNDPITDVIGDIE